ncbi:MAG: outer membrane protein assembly factor BamB family protein [Pseudobdellovibrio sp.]
MNSIKNSLVGLSLVALSACTSVPQNKNFTVNATWVQDLLAAPNVQFRKINRMSPLLYKKNIIAGNSIEGLISFDLKNKNINWRLPIPNGVEAGGVVIRDTLFVGSNNGHVYSVNLVNGNINWQFDTKTEVVAEPLLDEGILYFQSGTQSLYALDASTGKQLWIYSRQDTSGAMTIRGGSKPALSNGVLYIGFSDGTLVAINAKSGSEQWEATLNRNTKFKDIDSTPVLMDDQLLVNSYDDKLYCLSKANGEIQWSSPFGGSSTPLVQDGKIFNTSSKGDLVALDKKDGHLLWKAVTQDGMFIDPVLFNGLVVAGETQGKLKFFNPDSAEVIGSFEPGRGIFSKPTVQDNKLYFVSGEGNIYGVEAGYQNYSTIKYLR